MKAFLLAVRTKDQLEISLAFDETFRKDERFKDCAVMEGHVLLLSGRFEYRKRDGEGHITHRFRDAQKNTQVRSLTLDEVIASDRSEFRYSAQVSAVFDYEIDITTGDIISFGLPTDIDDLKWCHLHIKNNLIRVANVDVFAKKDDLYVDGTNTLHEFYQADVGFKLYISEKDLSARRNFIAKLGLMKTDVLVPATGMSYAYDVVGQPIKQSIAFPYIPKSYTDVPRRGLADNVARHIQYNHLRNSISFGSHNSQIIEACIAADDVKYQAFRSRIIAMDDGSYFADKRDRPVPKNGEKNAGDRIMKFRSDFDNTLMAIGATALYSAINVDVRNLGTRIVDDKLVPYIHTYNLYTADCEELAKNYHHCRYLDVSDFFNKITYQLVEDAVLALANESQKAGVERALSAIRKAMLCGGKDFLTIDSNYEHAIATVVMSYLLKDLTVTYRTFVDDTLLFNDDEAQLEAAVTALESTLRKYGLEMNSEKSYKFSGEYLENLKKLVFLPTGLRYRTDAIFTDIRLIGFEDFLKHNILPEVNAFSSAESMRKVFYYKEAEWVVKNYQKLCITNYDDVEVTEANILEILQHYTIRQTPLTGKELCRLVIIGEEFPSKWKWIISILKEADAKFDNTLMYHRSEYVRYLVTGMMTAAHSVVKPLFQSVIVTSQAELNEVVARLSVSRKLRGDSLNFGPSLKSVEICDELKVSYNDTEFQILVKERIGATLKDNRFMPESYPFGLWKQLANKGLNLYCEGAIV